MTKIRFIARFFLITAMLLSVVGKVQAQPPLPSHFHGEIHVLDNPPVVGSTINAYVPGVVAPVGSTTVTNSGGILVYTIDVAGDEPDSRPRTAAWREIPSPSALAPAPWAPGCGTVAPMST